MKRPILDFNYFITTFIIWHIKNSERVLLEVFTRIFQIRETILKLLLWSSPNAFIEVILHIIKSHIIIAKRRFRKIERVLILLFQYKNSPSIDLYKNIIYFITMCLTSLLLNSYCHHAYRRIWDFWTSMDDNIILYIIWYYYDVNVSVNWRYYFNNNTLSNNKE